MYLVGAPVLQILRSVSTDGKFIGEALLIWTVPMTTMGLIIFPKIWLVRHMQRMADEKANEASDLHSNSSRDSSADAPPNNQVVTASADAASAELAESVLSPLSGPRIQIVTFD